MSEAATTSTSFNVVADAHVLASSPSTNYGTDSSMKVYSPSAIGYLKFNPQGVSGTITKATLRLWATTSSTTGFNVQPVASTTWSESAITYNNRPAVSSTILSSASGYAGSGWLSLDVTPAVTKNAIVSFALLGRSTPQLMIGAKEAGPLRGATLVVETSTDTQAPTVPGSLQATPGDAQISLSWSASSDNTGVTGYRVYRNATQVASATATSYTDTGLTNGTSYAYTVKAVDGAGNLSASSASVSATPQAPPPPPPPPAPGTDQVRPYDAASPWNTPIPSSISVLPSSSTYVNAIVDNNLPLTSDPDQYALPVYTYNDQTPRRSVKFSGYFSAYDNGDNSRVGFGFAASVANIPIPDNALQSAGSDGQIVFWDPTTGVEYSFWQFNRDAAGNYTATNGVRYHTTAGYYGRFADGKAGRGAGTSYFAGMVRPWEIAQGHIDHALAFAYKYPSSASVYPAAKSDGAGVTGTDAPEGTRLQLDPNLTEADFSAWGLAPEAKVIARAMQKYGMYIIDNSGSSKIYLEDRLTAKWPTTITRDLTAKIPLSKFRAVAAPAPPA